MYVELEIDEGRTVLSASIQIEDCSFTHAFGWRHMEAAELQEFKVIQYIDGYDSDITEHLMAKEPIVFNFLKLKLHEHATQLKEGA